MSWALSIIGRINIHLKGTLCLQRKVGYFNRNISVCHKLFDKLKMNENLKWKKGM